MRISEVLREFDPQRSLPFENRIYVSICGSTNEIGKRIAAASNPGLEGRSSEILHWNSAHPWLVVALEQSRGKGRLGHRWQSPPGGIYVTIVLPIFPTGDLHNLPQLAGVGLCKGIEIVVKQKCRLKWPNDLQIRGQKVGGILIEVSARRPGVGYAVIGFGVNFQSAPAGLPYPATAILEEAEGRPQYAPTVHKLVSALCRELDHWNDSIYATRAFSQYTAHRVGDSMTCRMRSGSVTGTFLGFDPRGFLRLKADGSEHVLAATEIIPSTPERQP